MNSPTRPDPSSRPRAGLAVPTGILGTGVHSPATVVTNADLARTLDTTDEWIREKLGVRERRFIAPDEWTSDMCVSAATRALDAAGARPDEVDAVVLATISPDQPVPSTALTVAHRIGARRAIPIDLNQAACAAGVLAIPLASHLLQSDTIRTVLVIGADAMSRLTDPTERTTRVIFGDAAGAVVMGRVPAGYGLLSWDLGTERSMSVGVRAGGAAPPLGPDAAMAGRPFVYMDGRLVWQLATRYLPASIRAAVAQADLTLGDIRLFALHQANRRIITAVMEDLGVPADRASVTVDRLGNTCSASTLTALHDGMTTCGIGRDDLVVVAGIGAGFLWGSLCFRVW